MSAWVYEVCWRNNIVNNPKQRERNNGKNAYTRKCARPRERYDFIDGVFNQKRLYEELSTAPKRQREFARKKVNVTH